MGESTYDTSGGHAGLRRESMSMRLELLELELSLIFRLGLLMDAFVAR
jgi:hypothetical protein